MPDVVDAIVDESLQGARLDVFLAGTAGLSRSGAASLIRDGHIRVNGASARPSLRVARGDRVTGEVLRRPALSAVPESLPIDIVYQDQDLVIVDKPAGLVVHPAPGHSTGTLANALMALYPAAKSVGPADRPGIVHRLDKDTSGLLVIALNDRSREHLQRQIASRRAGRTYRALATGNIVPREGVIDTPIGRDPKDRKRMWVYGVASRTARTHYRVLEPVGRFAYLEVRLETGRTHQIRVHFAASGHPLAGDEIYGGPVLPGLARQFLHASELHLESPSTGEALSFHSDLAPDLQAVLDELRGTAS